MDGRKQLANSKTDPRRHIIRHKLLGTLSSPVLNTLPLLY